MLSNLKIWTYLSKDKLSPDESPSKESDMTENSGEISESSNTPFNSPISDRATDWGSYLLEAGKSATTLAAKHVKHIKQNVTDMSIIEHGNIISSFVSEQARFKDEKRTMEKRSDEACLPWIDALNSTDEKDEAGLKARILSVSQDERNFTRNPPAGSDFEFNYELYSPVAILLLKEDEKLSEMRFRLVPKKIKEEIFWRNYFYRISLIKQSLQTSNNDSKESTDTVVIEGSGNTSTSKQIGGDVSDHPGDTLPTNANNDELLKLKAALIQSGSITNNSISSNSASASTKTVDNGGNSDDWEAELQKELSEFELIGSDNNHGLGTISNELEEKADYDDIEKEIMDELKK